MGIQNKTCRRTTSRMSNDPDNDIFKPFFILATATLPSFQNPYRSLSGQADSGHVNTGDVLDFSGTTSLGKYDEDYLFNTIKSDYRCHSFTCRGVEAQVSPVPFVNPSSGIFKGYLYIAANITHLSTNLSLQVSSSY